MLPCRPAILSPAVILRRWATETRTIISTPGGQVGVVFTGEDLDIHHLAALAVRHAQRGIFHIARFLAKDGAQQALFGGQFFLALGRDLAHQDVVRADLGADADDAALVQVFDGFFAHVGDVAGDFFRTQAWYRATSTSYFSMCTEVKRSSCTRRSEIRMASSKLPPSQERKATTTFWPRASSPFSVEEESAMTSPLVHDLALDRRPGAGRCRCSGWSAGTCAGCKLRSVPLAVRRTIVAAGDRDDFAIFFGDHHLARVDARPGIPYRSRPAGYPGASSGTACACMFEPIRARLASSCSRKGISAALMPTIWCGATSM